MADLATPDPQAELYERDFALWAETQARLVRAQGERGEAGFDWDHVAEELEGLVAQLRAELRSRVATIIEHLLKLQYSPATAPRRGWRETVRRSRKEIGTLLENAPSLRRELPEMLRRELPATMRLTRDILADYGEELPLPEVADYTLDQVLGDWFPPPPPPV